MCVWPWRARMREMIAGRSMPSIVFSTKRPVAISAPVLPALTQASASPAFTRSIATRIEESFFLRRASCGFSSMATTCVASCTRTRSTQLRGRVAQQLLDGFAQTDEHDAQVGLGLRARRARRAR